MTIFLTGANGYIGSSVGKILVDRGHFVYGLIRDAAKSDEVSALGIVPIIGTLEDDDLLSEYAKAADGVIHAADSEHYASVQTILAALEGTGKVFIHTSGSSVIADDVLGDFENPEIFEENTPFIPLKVREQGVAINQMVRDAGIHRNIRTVVMVPSMIYGDSLGLDVESVQLPAVYRKSIESCKGVYLGKGINRWSNVNISDVVDLYLLALENAPAASYFYVEIGEESYKDLAGYISHALGFGGETKSWKAEEALAEVGGLARYALGSNSRVRAVNARKVLGWKPTGESVSAWISSNKYSRIMW
jgi:nucleoside-diphosphate-sugar epimerase